MKNQPPPAPNSVELKAMLDDLGLDQETRAVLIRLLAATLAMERGQDDKEEH